MYDNGPYTDKILIFTLTCNCIVTYGLIFPFSTCDKLLKNSISELNAAFNPLRISCEKAI